MSSLTPSSRPTSSAAASVPDPTVLLLGALAWVCGDDDRASRLLSLTGLDADHLRAHATDPAMLIAVGQFLADHEPDLLACAEALDITPAALITATRQLTGH